MHLTLWETVAHNWREVEDTVEKLSIVQKVTSEAIDKVDDTESVMNNLYNWDIDLFDDDFFDID